MDSLEERVAALEARMGNLENTTGSLVQAARERTEAEERRNRERIEAEDRRAKRTNRVLQVLTIVIAAAAAIPPILHGLG